MAEAIETISGIVAARNITEVVHFTSNTALVHILRDGCVLSREQLEPKFHAENVMKDIMNAQRRWDEDWYDYISLSITWINDQFFNICMNKWYADTDRFWVLLSFDPQILSHDGVVFATTNNGYHPNVRRAPGPAGLEALFAPTIAERVGRSVRRPSTAPANYPTCAQAEALYPRRLPLEFLRRVYVYDPELRDMVAAQAHALYKPLPDLIVDPARFERRP